MSNAQDIGNQEYAIDLLKRINTLTVEGKNIGLYYTSGTYSSWASQQFFILSQVKEFRKKGTFQKYKKSRRPRLVSYVPIILFNIVVLGVTLIALCSAMFRRPRVLLFCSDFLKHGSNKNPRLFNVLQFLQNEKIRYIEIIHVTTVRNFFINILKRRRLGIYGESISVVSSFISLLSSKSIFKKIDWEVASVEDFEKDFVQYIVRETEKNIRRSDVSTKLLAVIFKLTGIKKFVSIDDNRYLGDILYACEKAAVPSYIFQHSNFDYLSGLDMLPPEQYIFPDYFFTWNTYWLRRITEISPLYSFYASRLKIGGRPYAFTPPKQVEYSKAISNDSITVLIPYEVSSQREYIKPYMDSLLNDSRIQVLFVLRGDFEAGQQIAQYFGSPNFKHPQLKIITPLDKEWAISQADVVAGVYSGFLDESVEMGIPVCIFNTPYKNMNRLDRDNLASVVDSPDCDIFEEFNIVRQTSREVLQTRKTKISEGSRDIESCLHDIVCL